MVQIDIVRAANAAFADSTKKTFVAVVTGGTAGIGECAVRALATTFGRREGEKGFLRVYIVGRNEEAARKIIDDCTVACPGGTFRFHKGDLSLLNEVDRVCAEITQQEERESDAKNEKAKIDFLVCCQGILSLKRQETKEGLDMYFCLFYYSRMRFIDRLLPLLAESPSGGHVVSVLNSGVTPALVLDDLGLRNPRNQGLQTAFAHLVGMTNIFMEEVARRNPGRISLSHYYPGFVSTNIGDRSNFPGWTKVLYRIIAPLAAPFSVPFEECGQRVMFMASPARFPARKGEGSYGDQTAKARNGDGIEVAEGMDGIVGSGAYRVDRDDDTYPKEKKYSELRSNGVAEKVYQHVMTVFAEIEAGKVFKG
ncbi:NAD(P)-binding protein [Hypoxylon sp. NC1633]|nr:NAD(P)-binding protein [Hypoxylon sp. NC1633]